MSPRAERDWRLYAEEIIQACGKVRRYIAGMSYDSFVADERTQDAVMRNIEVIGEAAKGIPDEVAAAAPDPVAQRARHARHPDARVLWCVAADRLGDGDDPHGLAGGVRTEAARPPIGFLTHRNRDQSATILVADHVLSRPLT